MKKHHFAGFIAFFLSALIWAHESPPNEKAADDLSNFPNRFFVETKDSQGRIVIHYFPYLPIDRDRVSRELKEEHDLEYYLANQANIDSKRVDSYSCRPDLMDVIIPNSLSYEHFFRVYKPIPIRPYKSLGFAKQAGFWGPKRGRAACAIFLTAAAGYYLYQSPTKTKD